MCSAAAALAAGTLLAAGTPSAEADGFMYFRDGVGASARVTTSTSGGMVEYKGRVWDRKGDGWHGAFLPDDELVRVTKRLRAERPEPGFVLSTRVATDGLSGDLDELRRQLDACAAAGIDHVVSAPAQRGLDEWLASVEALWRVFSEHAA